MKNHSTAAKVVLAEQHDVFGNYLEFLFDDVPPEVESSSTDTHSESSKTSIPTAASDTQEVHEPEIEISIPDWADKPFQCLKVEIGEHIFAFPVDGLVGVCQVPSHITRLPKPHDWQIGLAKLRQNNTILVDITAFLNKAKQKNLTSRQNIDLNNKKVILVGQGQWGILCDQIGQISLINKTQVSWKVANRYTSWILGSIRQDLHSLVDIEALTTSLQMLKMKDGMESA